ncbi:unnamed protein product [Adineta ricciae]|uniref:Uncharacterized protein n=1 Tax=Adineta ricciae TaxID=249248 RepID=A0A816B6U3_ADIRI|nr:unnamed protein product [Adineta ricciae]
MMKHSVFVEKLRFVEEEPCFVYVLHFIKIQNTWKAVVEHLRVLVFDEKLWSYEIAFCKTLDILGLDELLRILPHGLDIYYVRGSAYVNILSQEEIDGALLAKLPFDELRTLFPKLKDRVLFTERLDLLMKECSNIPIEQSNEENISNEAARQIFDPDPVPQTTYSTEDVPDSSLLSTNDTNCDTFQASGNVYNPTGDGDNDDSEDPIEHLPSDFAFVSLPEEIQMVIGENDLTKLRGHTNHRRILLNFVFKTIVSTYNLLYPNANDYFLMTQALLKALKISIAELNATNEWKEAIKQKFKNERRLLQNTSLMVQRKRDKFGKGSGRLAKKSEALSAERKPNKMICVSPIIDETDVEQLVRTMRDGIENETIDNDVLITLWKKTFGYRRLFIRSHTISEILEKFLGYSYAYLMFEEVKMIENIDIEQNVNEMLPHLFEKLPNNSSCVMDVLPIRVIKILCKHFNQSISHILFDNEPIVPTPCIQVSNENFELYLDWRVVIRTTNPTTALSLLLSLYNIFEVKFTKNNHTSHLLYGIFFQNGDELGKNLRILLNSWHFKLEDRTKSPQIQTIRSIEHVDMPIGSPTQLHSAMSAATMVAPATQTTAATPSTTTAATPLTTTVAASPTIQTVSSSSLLNIDGKESQESPQVIPLIIDEDAKQQGSNNFPTEKDESEQMGVSIKTSPTLIYSKIQQKSTSKSKRRSSSRSQNVVL